MIWPVGLIVKSPLSLPPMIAQLCTGTLLVSVVTLVVPSLTVIDDAAAPGPPDGPVMDGGGASFTSATVTVTVWVALLPLVSVTSTGST